MVVNLFSFVIKTRVKKTHTPIACFEWRTRVFCVRLEHKTRISQNTSNCCCSETRKKNQKNYVTKTSNHTQKSDLTCEKNINCKSSKIKNTIVLQNPLHGHNGVTRDLTSVCNYYRNHPHGGHLFFF